MSINEIIVYLMVVFMALGAVDRILGNRFGLGEKFEEGIMAMGSLALAMIGIICLAPVLANLLRPVVVPLYQALGADPAMFAGTLLANDMGGAPLAQELALTQEAGQFGGLIVGSMLGPTIVFTIPVGLGIIKAEDRPYLATGVLAGVITIPIGNVIGGAMHDYFSGMICLRDGGTQMPDMVRKYSNKGVFTVYQIFLSVLLLLVGAVFIYTPGDIAATQVFGFSGAVNDPTTWIIYGVIFVYYLIATVFPIDAIIGRIYPIFGAILLFSAVGVFIGLFVKGYPLLNLWDNWQSATFNYGEYFTAQHFIPVFFITVACGILSGFHSTQTAIISRTMKSERQGRMTFYNMMILEGFIAMIWAAAAMGVYNLGLQEVNASLATGTIGVICKDILGPVGGIIALLGVIVLPITSGDTALRSLRLSISDSLHIDQSSKPKRLGLSAIIFALVAVILVFAKSSPDGFNLLWRYFAWSNQTLSLFAFLGISVWMFENSKAKWVWIPLIPAAWYTFVTVTYIANAQIGFHIPWTPAYIIGVCAAVAYVAIIVWYGKKRAARLQKL